MIRRIVAAVDDSPAGLAAAKESFEIATLCKAELRLVHVEPVTPMEVAPGVERAGSAGKELLDYVVRMAEQAGVAPDVALRHGYAGEQILLAAREWQADLIVIGRRDTGGAGEPYVGGETREVLEFCECPVLVVPRRTA